MTNTKQSLLYDVADTVATITLNRPDELNAITLDMLLELPRLLALAVANGARAILVTGAGRAFCSGAALGVAQNATSARDLGDIVETYYSPMARAFAESPVPIVTAINGPAAGA